MGKNCIDSTGLLYLYLRGERLDDGTVALEIVDTYKYFPEGFYRHISNSMLDGEDASLVSVFAVIGESNKVCIVQNLIEKCLKDNYHKILEGKRINKFIRLFDKKGNAFNRGVQEYFCEVTIAYPKYGGVKLDELEMYYVFGGEVDNNIKDCLAKTTVETWLKKEQPMLVGKQVMVQSFHMHNFVGRKLISALPFGKSNTWKLLFEGGRCLSFNSEYIYDETIPAINDMGFFTASGVEQILLNPIYAFGEWYTPNDICTEWHKVFLYACALRCELWDIDELSNVYEKFLYFLSNNICQTQKAPIMISKELYYKSLLAIIKQFQGFLKGEDEIVVSKELLQVLNRRYIYLSDIYEKCFNMDEPIVKFSQIEMAVRIKSAIGGANAYQKGLLWEDAVEYYLSCIKGLRITGKRVRAGYQEIDMSVVNISLDDTLWEMGAYILIECKNYSKHVGIKEIRNTAYICDMKGCKTAVIFAVNGVTRDAQGEIERLSKVNLQILCITKEELLLLNSNQDCTDLLLRKLFENKSFSENEILV